MDQRLIHLYDDYIHVHLDRRLFVERAAKLVGGAPAAAAALALLRSNDALAETVKENDPRITVQRVTFAGPDGIQMKGYLALPKTPGNHSAVLVIHQNRGLNRHMEDIARRMATENYAALAVDLLSVFGGTPADEEEGGKLIAKLTKPQILSQSLSAIAYLRARPDASGKLAALGFCWGGSDVNDLAAAQAPIDVGIAYYGTPPALDEVPKIKTPLLLHYADEKLDPRLGGLAPPYEAALKAAKKTYALYWYPGANHGFNDDSNPARHNEAAAKLAWGRTMEWLKKYLG